MKLVTGKGVPGFGGLNTIRCTTIHLAQQNETTRVLLDFFKGVLLKVSHSSDYDGIGRRMIDKILNELSYKCYVSVLNKCR